MFQFTQIPEKLRIRNTFYSVEFLVSFVKVFTIIYYCLLIHI